MAARDYDSTVARIAGNLLSDLGEEWVGQEPERQECIAFEAVKMARLIVRQVRHAEAQPQNQEEKS